MLLRLLCVSLLSLLWLWFLLGGLGLAVRSSGLVVLSGAWFAVDGSWFGVGCLSTFGARLPQQRGVVAIVMLLVIVVALVVVSAWRVGVGGS